jgi:hypothetical protein
MRLCGKPGKGPLLNPLPPGKTGRRFLREEEAAMLICFIADELAISVW